MPCMTQRWVAAVIGSISVNATSAMATADQLIGLQDTAGSRRRHPERVSRRGGWGRSSRSGRLASRTGCGGARSCAMAEFTTLSATIDTDLDTSGRVGRLTLEQP